MSQSEKTRLENLRAKKKAGQLVDAIEIKILEKLEMLEATEKRSKNSN
jgi:hypothetical protein